MNINPIDTYTLLGVLIDAVDVEIEHNDYSGALDLSNAKHWNISQKINWLYKKFVQERGVACKGLLFPNVPDNRRTVREIQEWLSGLPIAIPHYYSDIENLRLSDSENYFTNLATVLWEAFKAEDTYDRDYPDNLAMVLSEGE